jgi:hypothetical protein
VRARAQRRTDDYIRLTTGPALRRPSTFSAATCGDGEQYRCRPGPAAQSCQPVRTPCSAFAALRDPVPTMSTSSHAGTVVSASLARVMSSTRIIVPTIAVRGVGAAVAISVQRGVVRLDEVADAVVVRVEVEEVCDAIQQQIARGRQSALEVTCSRPPSATHCPQKSVTSFDVLASMS